MQESVHSMSLARGTQLQQLNEKKEKKHVRLGGKKGGQLNLEKEMSKREEQHNFVEEY